VDESLCRAMERCPPIHYCAEPDKFFLEKGWLTQEEYTRREENYPVCRRITKELREQPKLECPSKDSLVRQNVKSVAQTKGAKKLPVNLDTTKVKCRHCKRMVDGSLCRATRYYYCAAPDKFFLEKGWLTQEEYTLREENYKVCRRIAKELREQPGLKCPSTVSLFRQNTKSVTKMSAKKIPVTTKVKCRCCKRMVDESLCNDMEYCDVNEDSFKMGLMTEAKHKRGQDNLKVCRSITKELREQPKPCVRCGRVVERSLLEPCYAVNEHGMPLYRCTQGKSPGWFSGWSKEKKATEKRKRKNYKQCVANTKQL